MKILGYAFVGIETARAEELAAFARDVLGLEAPPRDDGRHIFELDDRTAFALMPPAFMSEPHDTVIAFVVDDLDAALEECRAKGVELAGPLLGEPGARLQHLTLPDGRFVALAERG